MTAAFARQARFAFTALTATAFVPPSPPMDVELASVRGADVFVVRRIIDKSSVDFRVAVEEDGVYIHAEGDKVF